ncbi:MAG: hypothetical protein QW331_00080 [Candidatus Woesearchaeota archaeon]
MAKKKGKTKKPRKFRFVPLKGTVMATSIIGLMFTIFYWDKLGIDWGTAFFVVFLAIFIATLLAVHKAPLME